MRAVILAFVLLATPAMAQNRTAAPVVPERAPNPVVPHVPPAPPGQMQTVPPGFLQHPSNVGPGDICYQFTPEQGVAQLCTDSVPKYCSVGGKFIPNIARGAPTLWSCFSADGERSWVIDSSAIDQSAWNN